MNTGISTTSTGFSPDFWLPSTVVLNLKTTKKLKSGKSFEPSTDPWLWLQKCEKMQGVCFFCFFVGGKVSFPPFFFANLHFPRGDFSGNKKHPTESITWIHVDSVFAGRFCCCLSLLESGLEDELGRSQGINFLSAAVCFFFGKKLTQSMAKRLKLLGIPYFWAIYNDQTAEVTPNGGLVRESPPKWP